MHTETEDLPKAQLGNGAPFVRDIDQIIYLFVQQHDFEEN
jgi:hypothetical protein